MEVWLVDAEAIKPHETSGDDDVVVVEDGPSTSSDPARSPRVPSARRSRTDPQSARARAPEHRRASRSRVPRREVSDPRARRGAAIRVGVPRRHAGAPRVAARHPRRVRLRPRRRGSRRPDRVATGGRARLPRDAGETVDERIPSGAQGCANARRGGRGVRPRAVRLGLVAGSRSSHHRHARAGRGVVGCDIHDASRGGPTGSLRGALERLRPRARDAAGRSTARWRRREKRRRTAGGDVHIGDLPEMALDAVLSRLDPRGCAAFASTCVGRGSGSTAARPGSNSVCIRTRRPGTRGCGRGNDRAGRRPCRRSPTRGGSGRCESNRHPIIERTAANVGPHPPIMWRRPTGTG